MVRINPSLSAHAPLLACIFLLASALLPAHAQESVAEPRGYDLTITEELRAPAGRQRPMLLVNGQSPAPVLRFTEGDWARITVRNGLSEEETSIHWHGLLVPNRMDGVPYLTTPPIAPGGEHVFEFELRQSGTYWYHSHTGLQEQRGVYGAIVIEPRSPERDLGVDREHVVVLSDWTDENPSEVMRTLMRGSEWYALKKCSMQSLVGAKWAGMLGGYWQRERSRMPPMDVSDVAYDAFLANGFEDLYLAAEPGERVLLRIVNAGASTYFHLGAASGPLEIVAADGMPVEPVQVERLLMGMAETYDLVVTMPEEPVGIELRATAHDGSGHASMILGQGPLRSAEDPPRPMIYGMDEMMGASMASMDPEVGKRAGGAARPFAPYSLLRSTRPTTVVDDGAESGVRNLTMRLTGDMQRYLWGFDGKPLSEEAVIPVAKNEVLRIEFINDTMMHHPLHLHGHFFRLLNGQGEYSPLKHTVDVPPMGRRTIEWIADEEVGDWFFHCHMLYHMDAGMARVFSYEGQGPNHTPSLDPKLVDPTYFFVDGSIQNHMTMGRAMIMRGREDFVLRWNSGIGEPEHADREIDAIWSHYFGPNFSSVLGFRWTGVHGAKDRPFAGIKYRLPYFFRTTLTVDGRGDGRFELEKELQLTERLALMGDFEYDTNTYSDWSLGANYTVTKRFGFITQYHSEHGLGAGLSFSF